MSNTKVVNIKPEALSPVQQAELGLKQAELELHQAKVTYRSYMDSLPPKRRTAAQKARVLLLTQLGTIARSDATKAAIMLEGVRKYAA